MTRLSKIEFARNLRRNMTDAEQLLWRQLRNRQLNARFRRQTPIGNYIVDFVCYENRLIIELDGGQHNEAAGLAYDQQRDDWLSAQGFQVLRFWNHELLEEMDAVLEKIWSTLHLPKDVNEAATRPLFPPPAERSEERAKRSAGEG